MEFPDLKSLLHPSAYDDDRLLMLHNAAEKGIAIHVAYQLLDDRTITFPLLEATTGISLRTIQRRKKDGTRLSPAEGSNLLDGIRVIDRAVEVFGNHTRAMAWMERPIASLKGCKPIDFFSTSLGRRAMERTLGRIEHGIFG